MALCLFLSKLEQMPGKAPGWICPRAYNIMPSGTEAVWATTSGELLLSFAIGVASMSSASIVTMDTDPLVWARELPPNWRTMTVSQLPAGVITKLNGLISDRGLNPGILGTDSLPAAVQKIINSAGAISNNDISLWPQNFHAGLATEVF